MSLDTTLIQIFWFNITKLGHAAIMLPLAAAVLAQLLVLRNWRAAICWSVCFSMAIVAVLATKIAFVGWGIGIQFLDFTGISGHSMLAAAALPVFFWLLADCRTDGRSISLVGFGLALSIVVGASRCVLGFHSVAEVVAGTGLGAMVAAVTCRSVQTSHSASKRSWPMIVASSLLGLSVIGLDMDNEKMNYPDILIEKMALKGSGRDSPYSRSEWRTAGKARY